MNKLSSPRYFAKLLFQFRVGERGYSKLRTCEERIVSLNRKNAASALKEAKQIGMKSEFLYANNEGRDVHFEFVGILDLMEIGIESEPNEVWYEIKTMLRPMERKDSLLPSEERLLSLVRGERMAANGKPKTKRVRR